MNARDTRSEVRPSLARVAPALVIPGFAVGIIGSLMIWLWRNDLPSPVATHFTFSGHPDGFTSIGWVIAMPMIMAVFITALGLGLMAVPEGTRIARWITGVAVGLAAGITVLMVMLVAEQRELADAVDAQFSPWTLLVAVVVGVVVGLLAALCQPRVSSARAEFSGERPVIEYPEGERFVWTRRISSTPLNSVLLAVLTFLLVIGVATRAWIVIVVAVILAVPMVLLWSIRVTVTRDGVSIRGALGRPRIVIPAADIDYAELVDVSPIRDYGGFGIRLAVTGPLAGTRGIVFTSGPAIMVYRKSSQPAVVVADDAARAVGLINGALRSAHRGG